MLNVYEVAKRHNLDTPWRNALRTLALMPESGTFMKRGQWDGVSSKGLISSVDWKLNFTTDEDVEVFAAEQFVVLKKDKQLLAIGWIRNAPLPPEPASA